MGYRPLEWNITYAVNVADIDSQHQKLFDFVNRFGRAALEEKLEEKSDEATLSEILDRLVDYCEYHFAHEEDLLGRYGYPQKAEHEEEHRRLSRTVAEFKTSFQRGNFDAREMMEFLTQWLKIHILVSDQKYARYLHEKGVH